MRVRGEAYNSSASCPVRAKRGRVLPYEATQNNYLERVKLVSYSDIQTLTDLSCYVTLPEPYLS